MKQVCILLFLIFIVSTSYAALIRVNNTFGVNAQFTTAQAAHNAAAAGDTIYLESSASSYGGLSCSKQLVWIGVGYFLDPNNSGNTGLQFHTGFSYVSGLTLSTGSANSVFMGLTFGGVSVLTNNITITRCDLIGSLSFTTSSINLTSNFTLSQSMVSGSITESNGGYTSSGYAFLNNIVFGTLNLPAVLSGIIINGNYLHSTVGNGFVVSNNILYNNAGSVIIGIYSSNVYNNIFMYLTNSYYVGSNGNMYVAGNPNLTNNVFTGSTTSSYDSWITLKAGSPAIGAGYGGIDIGPRGGLNPYKLSGVPNVPSIYQFQFRSTPVNTLPITISTRSNN